MIKNIQRAKDDGKREKTALPPFVPSHRLPRAFFSLLSLPMTPRDLCAEKGVCIISYRSE